MDRQDRLPHIMDMEITAMDLEDSGVMDSSYALMTSLMGE